jgi:Ras-related protein Rab-8A
VTDKASFTSIKTWVDEIERNADKHVNKILIGNKSDVEESQRAVSRAEGEKLAADFNMRFFETSAKKGINVADAFECIAKQVVERVSTSGPRPGAPKANVVIDNSATKKKPCACS